MSLMATLLLPGPAEAGGDRWGGGGPGITCPDGYELDGEWCIKRVTETFDADEHVTYECPDGFSGPNRHHKCRKVTHEVFPADPITRLVCPDGFIGPDSSGQCSKTETVTDVVHVDEGIELVCPEDAALDGAECVRDAVVVTTAPPETVDELVCPDGYDGPNASGECVREVAENVPATAVDLVQCPQGWMGPNTDGNCTFAREVFEVIGAGFVTTTTCPDGFTLDAPLPECITLYPATVVLTCPPGFELQQGFGGAECIDPNSSLPGPPPMESIDCVAPSSTLIPPPDPFTDPMCELRIPASESASVVCPAGYVGPDVDNRCVIQNIETDVVPAIVFSTLECPTGYLGPDANQECTRFVTDIIAPTTVTTEVCNPPTLGPNASGDCVRIETETVRVPAIERPVFTCPVGYAGPDAAWNCSRDTTETTVVDAEVEIIGYTCPADAEGPDGDNVCSRRTVEKVDPIRVVTYTCPQGADGPDADNQCTKERIHKVRPNGHDCRIKFYDFPDGSRLLFSLKSHGAHNLGHHNDDVESVRVPAGCTVSVAEHHHGGGWCMTLGPGLHNLPDDELSWFSIPGTGCHNPWTWAW